MPDFSQTEALFHLATVVEVTGPYLATRLSVAGERRYYELTVDVPEREMLDYEVVAWNP